MGNIAYELLTGKHPLSAATNTPPPALREWRSDLPDIYQRIVDKTLADDPNERYRSGSDLAGDLLLAEDFIGQTLASISNEEKFARTRELEFFSSFADSEVWEIAHAATWITAAPPDTIIREGDSEPSFYLLIDGEVGVYKGAQKITKLTRGDCFGEMGIAARRPRSATIKACSDVTAIKLQDSVIERMSEACQIRFQRNFLFALVERLQYTTDMISTYSNQ